MEALERRTVGDISIMSRPSRTGGYVAWGKIGVLLCEDLLEEPGDIYFNFDDNRSGAESKVFNELLDMNSPTTSIMTFYRDK